MTDTRSDGDCFTIGENRLWWDAVGCHLGIMLRHGHQMGRGAQNGTIPEMLRGNLKSSPDLKQSHRMRLVDTKEYL